MSFVNYGITSFDNLATSLLTIFIMINESWCWYLFNMMDADLAMFGVIVSILLLVIGSFFMMNLIAAVII
jgi:Ion transport protein